MPHISVTMHPGRPRDLKERLARRLKEALIAELGCSPDVVSVSIGEVSPDSWKEHVASFPEEDVFIKPGEKQPSGLA